MAKIHKGSEGLGMNDSRKFYGSLAVAGIVLVGGAFFIGTSDDGQINVAGTIQTSNEMNEADGTGAQNVASVPDAFRNMPNGGLVPQDGNPNPAPTPEPVAVPEATSTATSTETADDAALSTEE